MRNRTRPSPLLFLGTTLLGAGVVGAVWAADARRRTRRIARVHRALVDLLLNAMSAGDPVTERHCRRVANLTDAMAGCYGFGREGRAQLRVASLLHDMGKIDDRLFPIVHSCEPLTDADRQAIEQHPNLSGDILRPLERIHPGITRIIESHHERWDGQGYPRRLQGEDIPLEARIISVADVFDALSQPRSYHEPLSIQETLDKIRDSAGMRFDPHVVRLLDDPRIRQRWVEIARRGRRTEQRWLAEESAT